MRLTLGNTWFLLILLVISTTFFTYFFKSNPYFWEFVLILSGLKFVLVAFIFMELKKANTFWKIFILFFISIFIAILLLLK
jgi:hypothetical protein